MTTSPCTAPSSPREKDAAVLLDDRAEDLWAVRRAKEVREGGREERWVRWRDRWVWWGEFLRRPRGFGEAGECED